MVCTLGVFSRERWQEGEGRELTPTRLIKLGLQSFGVSRVHLWIGTTSTSTQPEASPKAFLAVEKKKSIGNPEKNETKKRNASLSKGERTMIRISNQTLASFGSTLKPHAFL